MIYSSLNYANISGTMSDQMPLNGKSYWFAEPALTMRVGFKPVKLQLQLIAVNTLSGVQWGYVKGAINLSAFFAFEKFFPAQKK